MEPAIVRTTSYQSSDATAIRQYLADAYGTSLRIAGRGDGYRLHHQRTAAGPVALDACDQTADVEFQVDPLRKIVVIRTVAARVERSSLLARLAANA